MAVPSGLDKLCTYTKTVTDGSNFTVSGTNNVLSVIKLTTATNLYLDNFTFTIQKTRNGSVVSTYSGTSYGNNNTYYQIASHQSSGNFALKITLNITYSIGQTSGYSDTVILNYAIGNSFTQSYLMTNHASNSIYFNLVLVPGSTIMTFDDVFGPIATEQETLNRAVQDTSENPNHIILFNSSDNTTSTITTQGGGYAFDLVAYPSQSYVNNQALRYADISDTYYSF